MSIESTEKTKASLKKIYERVKTDINTKLSQDKILPFLPYIIPQSNGEGSISYDPKNLNKKVSYPHLFKSMYGESLQKLEESDEILPLFKWRAFPELKDKKGQKFFSSGDILKVLCDLFADGKIEQNKIKVDNLGDRIDEITQQLLSEKQKYRIVLGLSGIILKHHIETENFVLRTTTWNDRLQYYCYCAEQNFDFLKLDGFDIKQVLNKAHCFLEYYFELDKSAKNRPGQINSNRIENIVALLRLHTPFTIRKVFQSMEELRPSPERIIFAHYGNHYGDEKHEIENSKNLKKFIKQNISDTRLLDGELGFIHERLRDLNEKGRSNEFRVFDYISIIESILVGSDQGEFTFKVPLYASSLLGKDSAQKKLIFDLVKKGYSTRSKIAHCAKIKEKHKFSNDELKKLTKHAHEILIHAVTNGVESVRETAQENLLK